ncbi:MAG: cadmium-translocating P-type ATPase [Burkholderiales bacterium]|nr:cadmium-translocating P-type ATPase [Burkholderiales bacterium]
MPASAANAPLAIIDDPIEQGRFTRWIAGERGQRIAESSLQLGGMHCAACAGLIEQALRSVAGVASAHVSAAAERATVCWDPERTKPSVLIDAVRRAGYEAVPDAAAPAREMRRQDHRRAVWRLFVASFCAMQVMMLATPSYLSGAGEIPADMTELLNWGSWLLSLPVLLFSAGPFYRGAWHQLRAARIGMDVPVVLGVTIAFIASTASTFDPTGPFGHKVYFDSLTMFVAFLLGARYLELRARQRAAEALEASLACLPETAWRVADDGSEEAVSVLRLRVGDRVRVPVGQAFPGDGVVEQGRTRADESLLSGESVPLAKQPGAEVVAGSINLGAPVRVRLLRVGGDTRLEAIVSMMRSAMSQRPAAARLADRWAGPFTWGVLLLAAGAAAVWTLFDPERAISVAVAVLIVTCPCALSLAAPAALVAAARGLARRGVMLQRLDAIEALAGVEQIFFDKTGTLTEDRPGLRGAVLTPAGAARFASPDAALRLAGSLARWSAHPLSRSLAAAVPDEGDEADWSDVEETAGQGVAARDADGRCWRLGRGDWVGPVGDAAVEGRVWLGCDGERVAAFEFEEALRAGAPEALRALREAGLRVTLLTGDLPDRALALAARVGLTDAREVLSQATPESKLEAVCAAQAAGRRVAMVGDGINDAPVLARADVSLAMGQGALVSRSQADAVITSNDLQDVVRARNVALRTVAIVRQNLGWALAYNAIGIPLALTGWLPPWAAGLGMATSSLVVVLNALRAGR